MWETKRLTLSAVGRACLKRRQAKVLRRGGMVLIFQFFFRMEWEWDDRALEPVRGREWA
jgi:hypothetical protein